MFGKKLIVIAATAALALGSISAKESTVHVRVHTNSKVVCNGPGQSPMSVEGAGTYCVTGQACVATISNGACPAAQPGLESGSHCAQVRPGVWGCRKGPKPAHHKHHKHHKSHSKVVCNGPGQSPMSVEGAGTYCVSGQACVANIANGACPGPQPGLESGSHCGIVKTGVYGCKPGPPPAAGAAKCDGPGQSPMSVEGAGTYCVTGQACVATISNGACPAAQPGLESGSHCAQVRPGVWGCRKGPKPAHHKHHKHHKSHSKVVCSGPGQSPMSVEGVEGVYCVSGQACVANIANGACPAAQAGLPNGSHCGVVKTGVYGCKPGPPPAAGGAKCDGPGQSPMSVEGAGTYCVTGQACVATISNGACPAAQPGLESGSHCAQVRPGVWGCRKGPKPAGNSTIVVVIDVEDSEDSDDAVKISDDSIDSADETEDSEDSEDSDDADDANDEDSEDSESDDRRQ